VIDYDFLESVRPDGRTLDSRYRRWSRRAAPIKSSDDDRLKIERRPLLDIIFFFLFLVFFFMVAARESGASAMRACRETTASLPG